MKETSCFQFASELNRIAPSSFGPLRSELHSIQVELRTGYEKDELLPVCYGAESNLPSSSFGPFRSEINSI